MTLFTDDVRLPLPPYTDDDLRRLKEMLEPGLKGHPDTLFHEVEEFFRFKADALLARLEAAEESNKSLYGSHSANTLTKDNYDKFHKWLEAAGK